MIRQSTEDRILAELKYGGKSIKELGDSIDSNMRGIYRAIGVLEKGGYINKVNGKYSPTPIGKLFGYIADEAIRIREVVEEHKEYIGSHRLDYLPEHFYKTLFLLPDLKIVGDDSIPFDLEEFVYNKVIETETKFLGISTMFTPRWVQGLYELSMKNINMEIIITEKVLKKALEQKEHDLFSLPNISWSINNEIKLGFNNNGKGIVLVLFDINGGIDVKRRITSNSNEAMKWGEELFEYFRMRSKPVEYFKSNVERASGE